MTRNLSQTTITETYRIILYNDEVNSFEWVIQALVDICDHTNTQAEQCAWIVHMKGKYAIKSGAKRDMIDRCVALLDRGLTAEVE
ncbi:MAG: ATP-dependent Clp protease adaptor ClpS [Bacteroidota bacterium]